MANSVELAVKVTSNTSDATSGLSDVGDAARTMASDVEKAASKADAAAGKMDRLGSSAETVDDKMGRTTGSLGALSAGFELVGADKYAAGLQSAAMATDFLSGAGQALILITEAETIANIKTTATTYAKVAAEKASAAAAKATAAAQWLLNAAMSANPIGLVVIAVIALVAGFVLLYKKSDKFRTLVNGLWSGIKTGITAASNALKVVLGGAVKLVQGYFTTWKTVATGAIGIVKAAIGHVSDAWGKVKDAVQKVIDKLGNLKMPDALTTAIGAVKDAVDDLIDAVDSLIGWLGKIKIPKLPSWAHIPGTRTAPGVTATRAVAGVSPMGRTTTGVGATTTVAPQIVINFPGLVTDPYATANAIRRVLNRRDLIVGTTPG